MDRTGAVDRINPAVDLDAHCSKCRYSWGADI